MNFAKPATTQSKRQQAPARFAFNWIELLAIPLAISIMETQPITLVLLFGSLLFTGTSTAIQLDAVSICLLLLGLHWWAMLVKQFMQRGHREKRAKLLYVLGLFASFVVIVVTHLSLLGNIPALVLSFALITLIWRQTFSRVLAGLNEAQVITSFKIGFFVLLAILLLAIVITNTKYKILLNVLTYSLPLFFFSSLATLSLLRLNLSKRAFRQFSRRGASTNPTRRWLILLALSCAVILVSVVILKTFTFQPLLALLAPLFNILGTFFAWLVTLLNALFHQQPIETGAHKFKRPPPPHIVIQPHHDNPLLVPLLFILVTVILLFLIIAVFREWYIPHKTDVDEERERLSLRSILNARWRKKPGNTRASSMLEPLDPTSARALYRGFLHAMARRKEHLKRSSDETPLEYQTRLINEVEPVPHPQSPKDKTLSTPIILNELTSAYMLERYAGKQTDQQQRTHLLTWVPQLVKRLTAPLH